MSVVNAFTVDVEDYYHVSALEGQIDRSRWGEYQSRVVANVERLLDLLETHDVLATFFVLGWVATAHPRLVQKIHARGHEIGSHSYWHRLVYRQTPEEFRADLRQSRDVLQDIIGARVTAYRAPSFSITRKSLWALEVLVEEGFEIDSSIFPIHHDRYGIPDGRRDPHYVKTPAGSLWEFPISVLRVAGLNFPISGGGYFRLYPLTWTTRALARINQSQQHPFIFYVHPWELDADQPRMTFGSRLSSMRHYVNLGSTEQKLNGLIPRFRFGRLCDVFAAQAKGKSVPTINLLTAGLDSRTR